MKNASEMTNPTSFRRGVIAAAIGALTFQLLEKKASAASIALPGCPESCGEIRVPYPFGIGQGCFHHGFNLSCDEEEQHPPRLFLGDGVEVLGISLPDGTVRITSNVLRSDSLEFNGSWSVPNATGPFKVSSARNSFVAFGCSVVAQLIPHSTLGPLTYASICAAMCPETLSGSSCSGVGCCRTSIAPLAGDLPSYGIRVNHIVFGQRDYRQRIPTAAFIVEQEWFSRNENEMVSNFSQYLHFALQRAPVVLEWSLDLISDEGLFRLSPIGPGSSDFRCLSPNSSSYFINGNYDRRRCNCSQGYEGNPYLSDGCQGIYSQQDSTFSSPCSFLYSFFLYKKNTFQISTSANSHICTHAMEPA